MSGKYRTVERPCDLCGSPYQARVCKLAKGVGTFCSIKCSARRNIGLADRRKPLGKFAANDPRRTGIPVKAVIDPTLRQNEALVSVFKARAVEGEPGECWPWRGSTGADGYGLLNFRGVTYRATRLAWQIANEEPIGLGYVMHSCDNPICINPAHLTVGSQSENMADMGAKKRGWRQTATACVRGHEYTPESTYDDVHQGRPRRRCKKCMADDQVLYRARKAGRGDRAEPIDLVGRVSRVWRR